MQNVRDVVPSKPYKFGAVIFLCHCVIMIRVFILRKSAKLVKAAALVHMSLKCFVTGLMWIKSVNSHFLLLVKSIYYVSHNTIRLRYACFNT